MEPIYFVNSGFEMFGELVVLAALTFSGGVILSVGFICLFDSLKEWKVRRNDKKFR